MGPDGNAKGAGRILRRAGLLAGAPLLLLLGCASTEPSGTLVQVNEFGATIARVQADSDAAGEKVALVAGRFGALLHFDFEHDALATFTEFHAAQEASVSALAKLRDDVAAMKGAADPFFKRWQQDLERIASTELRLRSQQRMTETRRRFDAIVASTESVQHNFEAFNSKMRDYSIFLAHDATLLSSSGEPVSWYRTTMFDVAGLPSTFSRYKRVLGARVVPETKGTIDTGDILER